MKITCIADTHGLPLPDIPKCDLLIVAGDIEDVHIDPFNSSAQRRYLKHTLGPWLAHAPARHIVGICGNHDRLGVRDPDALRALPWTYLCDESVTLDDLGGLVVHGSPWTPRFMDWWFMADEAELAQKWTLVPDDCDILVTHGPPYQIGDSIDPRSPFFGRTRDPHQGSTTLRAFIDQHPTLRLHVFGHIHESYGQGVLERSGLPPLTCVNASRVDGSYEPVHEATVVVL